VRRLFTMSYHFWAFSRIFEVEFDLTVWLALVGRRCVCAYDTIVVCDRYFAKISVSADYWAYDLGQWIDNKPGSYFNYVINGPCLCWFVLFVAGGLKQYKLLYGLLVGIVVGTYFFMFLLAANLIFSRLDVNEEDLFAGNQKKELRRRLAINLVLWFLRLQKACFIMKQAFFIGVDLWCLLLFDLSKNAIAHLSRWFLLVLDSLPFAASFQTNWWRRAKVWSVPFLAFDFILYLVRWIQVHLRFLLNGVTCPAMLVSMLATIIAPPNIPPLGRLLCRNNKPVRSLRAKDALNCSAVTLFTENRLCQVYGSISSVCGVWHCCYTVVIFWREVTFGERASKGIGDGIVRASPP